MKTYSIRLDPPANENQLLGAWSEELEFSAFGETKNDVFHIPVFV